MLVRINRDNFIDRPCRYADHHVHNFSLGGVELLKEDIPRHSAVTINYRNWKQLGFGVAKWPERVIGCCTS